MRALKDGGKEIDVVVVLSVSTRTSGGVPGARVGIGSCWSRGRTVAGGLQRIPNVASFVQSIRAVSACPPRWVLLDFDEAVARQDFATEDDAAWSFTTMS